MPPSKKDISSSRCVVPGCASVCLQVGSHCFPKNLELSKAWVEAIHNPMLRNIQSSVLNKNYHVCRLHFSSEDYVPRTTKATLRKNVVPSLHLPTDVDENITTSANVAACEQYDEPSTASSVPVMEPSTSGASANVAAHEECDEPSTASPVPLMEPSISGPPAKNARARLVSRVADLSSKAFLFHKKARLFQAKALIYKKRALSLKKRLQLATEFLEEH